MSCYVGVDTCIGAEKIRNVMAPALLVCVLIHRLQSLDSRVYDFDKLIKRTARQADSWPAHA